MTIRKQRATIVNLECDSCGATNTHTYIEGVNEPDEGVLWGLPESWKRFSFGTYQVIDQRIACSRDCYMKLAADWWATL